MIEQIIELILKEASGRPGKERVDAIYAVMMDIEKGVLKIISNAREIERRAKESEKES